MCDIIIAHLYVYIRAFSPVSFAQKLTYQHIWTYLAAELQTQEVLSAVLQPMLYIIQNSTKEEYDQILFPTLKYVKPHTERKWARAR